MRRFAHGATRPYVSAMASAVFRLLTLFAVLLMPAGMAAAPAAAFLPPSAADAGHCDEHGQSDQAPFKAPVHCAGCTALPMVEVPIPEEPAAPQARLHLPLVQPFTGIEPETATPPPRIS